jgi:two-component system response regulator HydG
MAANNARNIRNRIIGRSPALREALDMAERVATHRLSVLVHGETGTGKEAVARLIHAASGRPGPLVTLNCAALPDTLVESALFGHERGAFTDARTRTDGVFAQAHRGTLFLDEVAELSPPIQAKLLRVLQEGVVRRVGACQEEPVDVRVVSATHVDLDEAVRDGRFREDLRYRLVEVRLDLPPLRERGRDIGLLADHILRTEPFLEGRRLTPAARQHLMTLPLPGNVRELRQRLIAAALKEPVGPLTFGVVSDLESRVLDLVRTPVAMRDLLTTSPCPAGA